MSAEIFAVEGYTGKIHVVPPHMWKKDNNDMLEYFSGLWNENNGLDFFIIVCQRKSTEQLYKYCYFNEYT